MGKVPGRILKSDDVELEGRFHLDLARAGSAGCGPQRASKALAAPQVRILEKHPEYAIIQVTCTCGTGMRLRCEYAGAQASGDPQTQNSEIEVSEKAK